jgi:hypothetical protein
MNLGSAGARTGFHLHAVALSRKKPRHCMVTAFPIANAEALATNLLERRVSKNGL